MWEYEASCATPFRHTQLRKCAPPRSDRRSTHRLFRSSRTSCVRRSQRFAGRLRRWEITASGSRPNAAPSCSPSSTPQIDRVVQDVMVALERRRARNRARGYRHHQDHPRCRERACARTSVFNEGHGIPPSEQARQFTPFATLSKRTSESTGLGLFIAKGLVETMSGAIGFSTQPVENALFWFTLPIGRSAGSTPTLEEKRAHTIH